MVTVTLLLVNSVLLVRIVIVCVVSISISSTVMLIDVVFLSTTRKLPVALVEAL